VSGLGRRLAARWAGTFGPRTSGPPRSSNGASSFHLRWLGLDPGETIIEASVTLEIVVPPVVPHLYFWALQASFADVTATGAGHLGLQWYAAHPGGTAANWGGYRHGGGELDGTASELPSATGNPNTRDFQWEPGRPYRLTIGRGSEDGAWRGSVDGQVIRELHGDGHRLTDLMVWSEVFARCDDPSVVARWSAFAARSTAGTTLVPDRLAVSYQSNPDGGCDNSSVRVSGGVADQVTNTTRDVPAGAVLPL